MRTPLGAVSELDLDDHDVCARLLAYEKHTLIEGIVLESIFDDYLAAASASDRPDPRADGASEGVAQPVRLLPVDTAFVALPSGGRGPAYGAFVWARSRTPGLGRYLEALGARCRVWLVEWSERERAFTAATVADGQASAPLPLEDVCAAVSRRDAPAYQSVHPSLRETRRTMDIFWGDLASRHGTRLGTRILMPRIFINWCVQPWFEGGVWNLDRILLLDDQLWHMEIKHKFPWPHDGQLSFGLNDGELRQIKAVLECGLRTLHLVTVKPYWNTREGSLHLLNDHENRSRAAILSMELTEELVADALHRRRYSARPHTSLYGGHRVPFRCFDVTEFRSIGVLADPAWRTGSAILAEMGNGPPAPRCTYDLLQRLRVR